MSFRVHSFFEVAVTREFSTFILSIKANGEELKCRYVKLLYFGFLELKNRVNGNKGKKSFTIKKIPQKGCKQEAKI